MIKRLFFVIVFTTIVLFFNACGEKQADKTNAQQKSAITKKTEDSKRKKVVKEKKTINKKLLIGSWLDVSDAALHFTIKYKGIARSDNMTALLYKKWQLKGDTITFTIESLGNKTSSITNKKYYIELLNRDTLKLVSNLHTTTYIRKQPTTNIIPNQKITSPLKLKVNSQGVWFASEGELGTVEIVDSNHNKLNLKGDWGILSSIDGNWMHSNPAFFETTINFDPKEAKKGKLIIYNNPGPGEGKEAGVLYTLEIPVTF